MNLKHKKFKPTVKAKVKIARIVFNPHQSELLDHFPNRHVMRKGLYAHYCYDWDEMLIDETDIGEFSVCRCGVSNPLT